MFLGSKRSLIARITRISGLRSPSSRRHHRNSRELTAPGEAQSFAILRELLAPGYCYRLLFVMPLTRITPSPAWAWIAQSGAIFNSSTIVAIILLGSTSIRTSAGNSEIQRQS